MEMIEECRQKSWTETMCIKYGDTDKRPSDAELALTIELFLTYLFANDYDRRFPILCRNQYLKGFSGTPFGYYVRQFIMRTRMSVKTYLGAFYLIIKLIDNKVIPASTDPNIHFNYLFSTCLVASKYLYDDAVQNQAWAKASGIYSLLQVNMMEARILNLLKFDISIPDATTDDRLIVIVTETEVIFNSTLVTFFTILKDIRKITVSNRSSCAPKVPSRSSRQLLK